MLASLFSKGPDKGSLSSTPDLTCWKPQDLLPYGILASYAAVCADTFSSELGILSRSPPRLITSLTLRKVPPGTNGGVTVAGLGAGLLGSAIIAAVGVIGSPFCDGGLEEQFWGWGNRDSNARGSWLRGSLADKGTEGWDWREKAFLFAAITVWGALGSLLDSFLGGWLQESVIDRKTGKVVEGQGGRRVLINAQKSGKGGEGSRKVESGRGLLDNNGVNFLMAATMGAGAIGIAGWVHGVDVGHIFH